MPPKPGSDAEAPSPAEKLLRAGWGRPGLPDLRFSLSHDPLLMKAATTAAPKVLRLPVLLGDTADRPGAENPATLGAELFGQWTTGSLADYFDEVSYGALAVTGEVSGWHRLQHGAAWYEAADWPAGPGAFVTEVIALADAAGLDWGQFDNDGPDGIANSGDDDGCVDTAVIVHSGAGGECGGNTAIWSHTFFLRGWGGDAYETATPAAGGGFILVDDYTIQPELSCETGLIEIGVFCHELGHALGLPDLYDTRDGAGSGVGNWGLMGTGSWGGDGQSPWRPVHPTAWSKVSLDWVTPEIVECDGSYELGAAAYVSSVLKIWADGRPTDEYFLVENRWAVLGDADLPVSGLAIWHIDENEVASGLVDNTVNSRAIYGVALEQADGADDLFNGTNRGDAGDLFGAPGAVTFSETTLPASDANSGEPTLLRLGSIPVAGETMTLAVDVGVPWLDRSAPVVEVVSPVGGEEWNAGSIHSINWSATDEAGVTEVAIRLSRDGGLSFDETLATGLANSGAWRWQVPNETGSVFRIEVAAVDDRGNEGLAASEVFTLVDPWPPGVVVEAPSEGTTWALGSTQTISWQAADNIGVTSVDILLSIDGGETWPLTVAEGLPDAGSWNWQVAGRPSSEAVIMVRARDAAELTGSHQSPVFSLAGTSGVGDLPGHDAVLSLGPVAPNPFNPSTTIHFDAAGAGRVRIEVYDLAGRRLATLLDEDRPSGAGSVRWQGHDDAGRNVASGVYYIRAQAGGVSRMVKATLLK